MRVVFAILTTGEQVRQAATPGISGEMLRDLMLACVKQRFGTWPRTAGLCGSRSPGLRPHPEPVACFTRVRSP